MFSFVYFDSRCPIKIAFGARYNEQTLKNQQGDELFDFRLTEVKCIGKKITIKSVILPNTDLPMIERTL